MSDESKAAFEQIPATNDPMEFLFAVVNNQAIDMALRIEVADALMPYHHAALDDDSDSTDKKS